ncbi:GbsR/MarR family transcriptional regulator [Nonomuraea sp. NPDC050783]|uniref:GbsR/MarR family transcriptional regulator n=1 Tax=Nonomuraea sp. NPDC050783 TaxID=3154634 RepID=UPI0034666E20
MTARVAACLFCSRTGALTARELAERLRVSPASISTAVAYLEEQELIVRGRDPGRRRESYRVDDDMWYRAFMASIRRNEMIAELAAEGVGVFGPDSTTGVRMAQVSEFLYGMSADMARMAERWRQVFTGGRAAGGQDGNE